MKYALITAALALSLATGAHAESQTYEFVYKVAVDDSGYLNITTKGNLETACDDDTYAVSARPVGDPITDAQMSIATLSMVTRQPITIRSDRCDRRTGRPVIATIQTHFEYE